MFKVLIENFVTLFVVFDPIGSIPIFLNRDLRTGARRQQEGRVRECGDRVRRIDALSLLRAIRSRRNARRGPGI